MSPREHRAGLASRSAALVVLLASTWLVVGASLQEASTAVVSAGRTVFTVAGLLALNWWAVDRVRSGAGVSALGTQHRPTPYRWWQLLLLAISGVSSYTVFSTVAIGYAGPVLPTLIMSLSPAAVLIAEGVMTRTAPPLPTSFGTVLAVGGALLYVLPRLTGTLGDDVLLGTAAALLAMVSMVFYGIYFARVNRDYDGPMARRILPIFAIGAVPLALWATGAVAGGEAISWNAVGMLALLGIAIYVPVYLLQHRILITAGASYSALLGLAVPPVVGIGAAALHLAAAPAPLQFLGIAVTLLGMTLVIRRKLTHPGERA